MDEDQNSSIPEVATHDQEPMAIETPTTPAPEEDRQEKNWREVRKKQKEQEQELRNLKEMNEKLMHAHLSTKQVVVPDELNDISDDEFLTKKQSKAQIRKEAEEIAEKKFRQLQQESDRSRFLDRLKSKYNDFSDIVNPETIAIFEEKNPELAATIADLQDPYKMGMQTYNFIKSMGISEEAPAKRHAKEVEKKMDKNEKTVQSPQAYNKRPMAQAFRLTEADKTALYEEMIGFARGA